MPVPARSPLSFMLGLILFGSVVPAWALITDNADVLLVPAGETYQLGGEHSYAQQVTIQGTLRVQRLVKLTAPLITVGPQGRIDAQGQGEVGGAPGSQNVQDSHGRGGAGSGAGRNGAPDSNGNAGGGGGGGAGYGGAGAPGGPGGDANDHGAQGGAGGAAGGTYGTANGRSIEVGSGGGGAGSNPTGFSPANPGQPGGGAIWLAGDVITIEGELNADGGAGGAGVQCNPAANGNGCWNHGSGGGGGASGGGILLDGVAIIVNGTIHANGGAGGAGGPGDPQSGPADAHNGAGGGGGGGGRIKLFATCREGRGLIEVRGGRPGVGANHDLAAGNVAGRDGTIHSEGDVLPDGCSGPPRIVSGSPYSVGQNEWATLDVSATRDPDQGEVRVSWDLDGDGQYDDGNEWQVQVRWAQVGDYRVSVRAEDDQGEAAEAEIVIRVFNLPPAITSDPPLQAMEGTPWRYEVVVTEPGGLDVDPVHLELEEGPPGMVLDGFTLTWTPTPEEAKAGEYLVVLWAVDSGEGRYRQVFRLTVVYLDTDRDGMSDGWERQFGLDPEDPSDAEGDVDGDGLSNLGEYEAGTDPTRPNQPTAPTLLRPAPGGKVTSLTPVLTVENGEDPDGLPLIYEFELHGRPQLDDVLMTARDVPGGLEGTTGWQLARPLAENARYWWRARCSNGWIVSPWSAAGDFVVDATPQPPTPVLLIAPGDGAPVATATPELRVGPTMDPEGDEIFIHFQLFTDARLDELALEDTQVPAAPAGQETGWTVPEALGERITYWWRARAVDDAAQASIWSEVRSFRINTRNGAPPSPELLFPSRDSIVDELRPLLAFRNVEDPDGDPVSYELELDTDPTYATPGHFARTGIEPGAGGSSRIEPPKLVENTRYFWRVRATDGLLTSEWTSATFLVSRTNDPPSAPLLLAPADGERVTEDQPELLVGAATDPEEQPLSYYFELSTSRQFGEPILSPRVAGTDTGASWQPPPLPTGKTYYWRCRAIDVLRLPGPYSEVFRFVVPPGAGGGPPAVPEPLAPEDGATTGSRPVLEAQAVRQLGSPPEYRFRIASLPEFSGGVIESPWLEADDTTVRWTVGQVLEQGLHYWQVKASNGVKESEWSAARSFTVDPAQDETEADQGGGGEEGCAITPARPHTRTGQLLLGLFGLALLVVLRRRKG